MTASPVPAAGSAEIDAARLLLARLGVTAEDLLTAAPARSAVPTFAVYIPVVAAAVGPGARRVYGSYWNRILDQWGEGQLDEPSPSEIRHLLEQTKTQVVTRRNARGGRGAANTSSPRCAASTATPRTTASSPPPPATTPPWTRCCRACTPRPRAAAGAPWPCARRISIPTSA